MRNLHAEPDQVEMRTTYSFCEVSGCGCCWLVPFCRAQTSVRNIHGDRLGTLTDRLKIFFALFFILLQTPRKPLPSVGPFPFPLLLPPGTDPLPAPCPAPVSAAALDMTEDEFKIDLETSIVVYWETGR
jgi:hypothetical protein